MIRRATRVAVVAVAATLLGGCGVSTTGVIDAGPPGILFSTPRSELVLFYLTAQQRAVPTDAVAASRIGLLELMKSAPAQKDGAGGVLHSEIPSTGWVADDRGDTVRVLVTSGDISDGARRQFGCSLGQPGAWSRVEIATSAVTDGPIVPALCERG